jgi:hypothetical protein
MMKSNLLLEENKLVYQVEESTISSDDYSWELDIHDILIVGILDGLVGDTDTRYVIFIDSNGRINPINLCLSSYATDALILNLLKDKFNIEGLPEDNFDDSTVLYPKELQGNFLYKFNFISMIKTAFLIHHPALGVLSDPCQRFIQKHKNEQQTL